MSLKQATPSIGTAPNKIHRATVGQSIRVNLAGREGFEPSIPDPKSGALPLGDRPSPNLFARSSPGHAEHFYSSLVGNSFAATLSEHFVVLSDYLFFKHPARVVVDRMSDVLVCPILALLAWHRHKKTCGTMDDLQVAYHKAVIQRDRNISPKFILVDRKDPDFGNGHRDLHQLTRVGYS